MAIYIPLYFSQLASYLRLRNWLFESGAESDEVFAYRMLPTMICAPTPLLLEGRRQDFVSGEPTKSVTVLSLSWETSTPTHGRRPKTERGVRRKTIAWAKFMSWGTHQTGDVVAAVQRGRQNLA